GALPPVVEQSLVVVRELRVETAASGRIVDHRIQRPENLPKPRFEIATGRAVRKTRAPSVPQAVEEEAVPDLPSLLPKRIVEVYRDIRPERPRPKILREASALQCLVLEKSPRRDELRSEDVIGPRIELAPGRHFGTQERKAPARAVVEDF